MPALLGGIDDKISVFRERYNALWQRTIRHELFTPAHRKAQSAQFSLQKIEYLKGVSIKMKDCVILGMLTQMKEGEWWLEDPTGKLCRIGCLLRICFRRYQTEFGKCQLSQRNICRIVSGFGRR